MKNFDIKRIDWLLTVIPFVFVLGVVIYLFAYPEQSNTIISEIRFFFSDTLGAYYLLMGLGVLSISIFLSVSKYGNIVLGEPNEKPKYSFFAWGSMMFTCGLAADILFYSFTEWFIYIDNPYIGGMGDKELWSGVFSIFHWSFIPWAFYLVLAAAFGFMLHARKRNRQRYSEACRPVIGKFSDGIMGRIIDLFALFALLAGTATTFSVATPLLSSIIIKIFAIEIDRQVATIVILILTCIVYTCTLFFGFKGMSFLAKLCVYMFFGLLMFVWFKGGQGKFIVENGLQSTGKMIQNFITLATYTDPKRTSSFPQDWTTYYWAYWMVWCVAAPFFIGSISRGRTIRQTIFGGYVFGVGSTIISFIILGNYSLGRQVQGLSDFITQYRTTQDLYELILNIIDTLPYSKGIMIIIFLCMVAFYATSFDSIAYTAACYSYKTIREDEHPHIAIQLLWCVLLIALPVALVFSESSMNNIQSISIISAFPVGLIIIVMIWGFIKDAKNYIESKESVIDPEFS